MMRWIVLAAVLLVGCTPERCWFDADFTATMTNGDKRDVQFALGADGNVKWRLVPKKETKP